MFKVSFLFFVGIYLLALFSWWLVFLDRFNCKIYVNDKYGSNDDNNFI